MQRGITVYVVQVWQGSEWELESVHLLEQDAQEWLEQFGLEADDYRITPRQLM